MSRRQCILLILMNALISLAISVAVVWIAFDRWEARQPTYAPLPLPTVRPLLTPLKTSIVYIVQPGDSLSGIAIRFNIPLEELMRANGITDPDHINAGQRLIIPAGSVPEPTRPPTATPLPFEPPTAVVGTPAASDTATLTPAILTSTPEITSTLTITPTQAATATP